MTQKWVLPVVLMAILAVWGATCWLNGRGDEQTKREAEQHQRTTDSLNALLRAALSQRDTLVKTVVVERVKLVQAKARVDTVKAGFIHDTTTADSLQTALIVIATQDTLIAQQSSHIKTLNELVASDSGVIKLYQVQRGVDSLHIKKLERKVLGPRLFGIRLPKPKCGVGVGATYGLQNSQFAVGPTVGCLFGF